MLRCKRIQIAGRASVYGFARMNLDAHLPRWGVEEGEIERLAEGVLDPFIAGIAKAPAWRAAAPANVRRFAAH